MKKNIFYSSIILAFLILCLTFCQSEDSSAVNDQRIQNLRAFAKLYGYIKYFHPSDEASRVDWDAFAVYGVGRVKQAKNLRKLKVALEELFLPMAPTTQVYFSGQKPEERLEYLPEDRTGLKVVAWQHKGVGLGNPASIYASIRLNRENVIVSSGPGFGTVTQGIEALPFRGKAIKLKASVKTRVEGPGNQGQLWLRVDREAQKRGFFNNMSDRPIKSKEWQEYEIIGKVEDDALQVFFGCFLKGSGQVWVDEFQLSVRNGKGEWEPVEIKNPGFEEEDEAGKPKDWFFSPVGYSFKVTPDDPYDGEKCLLIESEPSLFSGQLFRERPEAGEVINKDIGAGLCCQIPLTLYSDGEKTLGRSDKYPFEKLQAELDRVKTETLTAADENLRLADVVIAWNVFQHFYPYFDVVAVDWNDVLQHTLEEALDDETEKDFFMTLNRMVAKLRDGHGGVYHQIQEGLSGLPIRVDWVENEVIITASKEPGQFRRGDIILEIDGKKAEQALLDDEEYLSGSLQWKRYKSLRRFGYGEQGSPARLKIKRGGESLEVEALRNFKEQIEESKRPPIEKMGGNIYYVDLSRAMMPEITERIEDIARAKGVVFDLRGYPNSNHAIIGHLLEEKDTSAAWMKVPLIIYPDQENIVGYQEHGWGLLPKKPHIEGKVVFLTDGRAISYAESFLSFIEHYKLGEIVGQPTAGANGNVNPFTLPGGFRVTWTGMRVLKHDGSQHHLIGIRPAVPLERTIQGVIEGRDEYLEKALEIIKRQ